MQAPSGSADYNGRMAESHLELTRTRCPRCAGQVVLRISGEERGGAVELMLDTACVVCGTSPWADQRTVVFAPGTAGASELLRETAEERRRRGEREQSLRDEITRLEGALADARVELRRAEEAIRGAVEPGKRPIEMD